MPTNETGQPTADPARQRTGGAGKGPAVAALGAGLAVLGAAGALSLPILTHGLAGTPKGAGQVSSRETRPLSAHRIARRHLVAPRHQRRILAVGAESQYANVISQIGGPYVHVVSFLKNPNTDPHVFEASTQDARLVAAAGLAVQNGLGYDSFMNRLEAASPNPHRIVITAAQVMHAPSDLRNPHLFYQPGEMARVAARIASALERLEPAHTAYFAARVRLFDRSLVPWQRAIAELRKAYRGAPVAVTEPVADDLLEAAGLSVRTPWSFQAAVMNSTDPSPQDVAIAENLILHHSVRVLVYNRQAVDSITTLLLGLARSHHIPVIGVYETLPPGLNYQTWMLDETIAIERALRDHLSSFTLR